jgi:undecaprenyl-diphosphatase
MAAAVFALLTQQVRTGGPLLGIDRAVHDHVQHAVAQHPLPLLQLDAVAEYWSDLGNSLVAVPLLAACAAVTAWSALRNGRPRWWAPYPAAGAAALLLMATAIPAKDTIARPGPSGAATGSTGLGYFPSGHAATATVCLVTGAWLLSLIPAGRRARMVVGGVTAVLCLGVGAGLIWHDYHWLLDVIGAWALSYVVVWCVVRWAPRPGQARGDEPDSSS